MAAQQQEQAVGEQPKGSSPATTAPGTHLLAAALIGAQHARALQEDPQD